MKTLISILCIIYLAACTTLPGRLQSDLQKVEYSDGISKEEAISIAAFYRLENLKWFVLSEPVENDVYWEFLILKPRTLEKMESPPLLIHKKAYSYESAVKFDSDSY